MRPGLPTERFRLGAGPRSCCANWLGNIVGSRRGSSHQRRKVRQQVLDEEDTCHICGRTVDVTLPARLPNSPEADDVIPVSLGGNPLDRNNLRLSHRVCNQKKGNGIRGRKAAPTTEYVSSRTWEVDE